MTDTSALEVDVSHISTGSDIEIAAKFFLGLAEPTRLRILALLVEEGEMRVGDLVDAVGGLQGRVSSHLACLRHCRLVTSRKEGRNVYYSVPDCRVLEFLPVAMSMVADNAEHIASCHRIGV